MKLTLKRGSGRTFDGENWKLVADGKWGVQILYVPHALEKEQHVGNRMIDGVDHAVFRCLNDEFFAQPVSVCEKPRNGSEEVVYELEASAAEEKPRPASKGTQGFKVLTFSGKNWKLAGEKSWKTSTAFSQPGDKDCRYTEKELVGERKIGNQMYEVFSSPPGFIAFRTRFTAAKATVTKLGAEREADQPILQEAQAKYGV